MNNSTADKPPRAAPLRSGWLAYAFAGVAVTVATLVRLALDTALGDNYPFATYFGAVAVVAWCGHTRSSVAALVLSGFVSLYLFLPPRYSLAPTEPGVVPGLALFLAVGGVIVAMSHAMRVARSRAEDLFAEAVVRQAELQRSVVAEAEQRERLRTTLAGIGDAVISTDRGGNVTYLNTVAESLTGWTNAEAAGVPLTTVFHIVNESTRLPVENPAIRALKEGVIVGLANHTILIARDGSERPIDDSAAPIRCKEGEVVGCVLVFRDVTERRRAETENREAQQQTVTTLESITDGFMRYDRDWRIVYVNAEAERINRLTRSEMLGKTPWELFPAVVGTRLEAEFRRAVAERVTVEFENHYEPFGRWYSLKGYPTPDGGLTTFIRDITDQKARQQALAASEARFRAGIEAVSSIVWTNDAQGMMAGEQAGWGKFTGHDREGYQGYGWSRAVHPDDAQPTIDAWNEAVAGRKTFVFEHRVRRSDGQWRRCSIRAVPVLDDRGEISEWVGVHTDITDRRRAEQALRESQQRLEAVLDSISDGLLVLDREWRYVYFSEQAARIAGVRREDMLGGGVWELYPHAEGTKFYDGYHEAVATGRAVHFEEFYPDPLNKWLECHCYPSSDGLTVYFRDVTARKQGEQEIVRLADESERRRRLFDTALSNTADFIYTFDLDGRFTYANAALLALWQRNLPDVVGKDFHELDYPPELADRLRQQIRRVIDAKQPVRDDTPYTSVPKGEREYEYILVPVLGAGGAVEAVAGSTRDITDRKRAEREIARLAAEADRQRRLYDTVLTNTPDLAYVFGLDHRFTYANHALLAMWGRTWDGAIGRNCLELGYEPWHAAMHDREIEQVVATRQPVRGEVAFDGTNGRRFYDYSFVPVIGAGGEVEAVAGTARDVTEARRSRETLERQAAELSDADRKKDEFLATLAHELRNPLAPLRNGLQIMKLAGGDAGAVEKSRSMMERQVGQMTHLIDDLMDLSRISRGKIALQKTRLRLADVVQDAVDTARPLVEERGHELVVGVPPEPLYVDADRTRLSQIFGNLLNNAAKYTDTGGRIRVAVERQGSDVVVAVEDNGVGIPAHLLTTVFDMFAQVDRSLEKSQGGLGIGLNIVKKLVEMHDGSIVAESGGHGTGSRFVVRLPVVLTVTTDTPDDHNGVQKVKPARRRILVVDDNEDGADSLAEMLRIMGNDTQKAHDGLEAVAVAAAFRPDVILMDIGMPRLNGYEACRRIRELTWGKNVIIVAQTGWGQEDDKRKSQDAGFNFHMVKPVDPAALEKMLAGLLVTTG